MFYIVAIEKLMTLEQIERGCTIRNGLENNYSVLRSWDSIEKPKMWVLKRYSVAKEIQEGFYKYIEYVLLKGNMNEQGRIEKVDAFYAASAVPSSIVVKKNVNGKIS